MLACRRVGASELTVLAWADRTTVFGFTDEQNCGIELRDGSLPDCSGNVVQVIVHYFSPLYQFATYNFFTYMVISKNLLLQGSL